jgi:type IV pilus assembly protein PilY1
VDQNTYTATDRIASRSQLAQQTITQELTIDPDGTGPQASFPARITSQNPTTGSGWYLDLVSPSGYNGERQVTDPLVRNDRVIFTTLIPSSDPCGFGGSSWLMVLDLLSGGRLTDAQLDTNGDGKVDGNDQPVSGVGSNEVQSRAESLTCISNDCGSDRLLTSGSSSELSDDPLRSVGAARGRQSWRQIR